METIIITRHAGLVEYIFEEGIAPRGTPVIPHANADDIRGRRVIGPLPLHLAALAASVVSIPLILPPELRGVELSAEQVRAHAQPPEEYVIRAVRKWSVGDRVEGGDIPEDHDTGEVIEVRDDGTVIVAWDSGVSTPADAASLRPEA